MLLENGAAILLEGGDNLLLEDGAAAQIIKTFDDIKNQYVGVTSFVPSTKHNFFLLFKDGVISRLNNRMNNPTYYTD